MRYKAIVVLVVLTMITILNNNYSFGQESIIAGESTMVYMKLEKSQVLLGEEIQYIDPVDITVTPILKNGYTYVPFKFLIESFGGEVNWNQEEQEMYIQYNDIGYTLKGKNIENEGENIILEDEIYIKEGTSYIPIRTICEKILDKEVFYQEGEIVISEKGEYSNNEEAVNAARGKYKEIEEKMNGNLLIYMDDVTRKMVESPYTEELLVNGYVWGFKDYEGNKVIDAKFSYLPSIAFQDGFMVCMYRSNDDIYSVVLDTEGNEIPIGYAHAESGSQYGWSLIVEGSNPNFYPKNYVNRKGERLLKEGVEFAQEFKGGLAYIEGKIDGEYYEGFIDTKGQPVLDTSDLNYYNYYRNWSEGLCGVIRKVGNELKTGYINRKGEEVIPCIYEWGQAFKNGVARVTFLDEETGERKTQFIDKTGKVVVEDYQYNTPNPQMEEDELVPVEIQGRYGYRNKEGRLVIPAKYEMANEFSEELAAVKIDGKYGFVNKNGDMVIQPKYRKVFTGFQRGVALVDYNQQTQWIDNKGNTIVSFGELTGEQGLTIDPSWQYYPE